MWKTDGHFAVKKALDAQVLHGKFAHAYLFLGPKGAGKLSLAREFALAIRGADFKKNDSDIFTLTISGDFGITETRELIGRLSVKPLSGKYKVGIIHDAHALNSQSANALLKTIEEPSSSTILILTAQNRSLPATIFSRCQVFTCNRPAALNSQQPEDELTVMAEFNEIRSSSLGQRMLTLQTMALLDMEELREKFRVWTRFVLSAPDQTIENSLALLRALEEADAHAHNNANKKLILERLLLALPVSR